MDGFTYDSQTQTFCNQDVNYSERVHNKLRLSSLQGPEPLSPGLSVIIVVGLLNYMIINKIGINIYF